MGILLASLISPKAVGVFILIVFIAGICMGPKGTGGSKKDHGNHRNGVKTHDLHNNPANKMQGHGDKRGI